MLSVYHLTDLYELDDDEPATVDRPVTVYTVFSSKPSCSSWVRVGRVA